MLKHFKRLEAMPKLGDSGKVELKHPISEVYKYLVKVLKGDKAVITAVKLYNGKIEEVEDLEEAEAKGSQAAVSTTVPSHGCPMPIYKSTLEKEIRATRVLTEFLNPTQLRDFNTKACFVVRGIDSNHRMMLSHRYSRAASEYGLLYDLDRERSVCIEKTILPPAEELLALLVMLSCRGREKEWRVLNHAEAN